MQPGSYLCLVRQAKPPVHSSGGTNSLKRSPGVSGTAFGIVKSSHTGKLLFLLHSSDNVGEERRDEIVIVSTGKNTRELEEQPQISGRTQAARKQRSI